MDALIIANTQIRRDGAGRYCLNDLHQASGGEKRHQPSDWLRIEQTKELIGELKCGAAPGIPGAVLHSIQAVDEPVVAISGGFVQGTYAVKELVYAYAMWISAKFHLHVIRAYDSLVQQAVEAPPIPLLPQPEHRADQLVSAGRIFSAALRTARQMKLHPRRALRQAALCSERHTGINWLSELDANPDTDEGIEPGDGMDRTVADFMAAWRASAVPMAPALSTDVFEWYRDYCVGAGVRSLSQAAFVPALASGFGFHVKRARWFGVRGTLEGPHTFLYPGLVHIGEGREAAFLGRCVVAFRDAMKGAVIA